MCSLEESKGQTKACTHTTECNPVLQQLYTWLWDEHFQEKVILNT